MLYIVLGLAIVVGVYFWLGKRGTDKSLMKSEDVNLPAVSEDKNLPTVSEDVNPPTNLG